jgi:hypothetical protein
MNRAEIYHLDACMQAYTAETSKPNSKKLFYVTTKYSLRIQLNHENGKFCDY